MSFNCTQFDPEVETVSEFIERFTVQCSEILNKNDATDATKAATLIKALPVSIVTDLQRGLKPTKLSDAKFDDLSKILRQQYEIKKSIVAASYSFVSRKQKPGETIEQFAQVLNNLAEDCEYGSCCRSRYLRDIFVAGLSSSKVISALLHQECDKMSFKDVVEKAKTIEAFSADVENIKSDGIYTRSHKVKTTECTKYKNFQKNDVPSTYVCILSIT